MSRRKKTYKVVVVGDTDCGKSSLLFRFQYRKFNKFQESTIAAALHSKVLSSGHRVNMWDTAGQEKYHSLIPMYLKDIDLVLYVYDITRSISFDHIKTHWVNYVTRTATKHFKDQLEYDSILIGNKTDLSKKRRQVSSREGADYAKALGILFAETSALDGTNADAVWSLIERLLSKTSEIIEKVKDDLEDEEIVNLSNYQKAKNTVSQKCFGGNCVLF